MRYTVVLTPEPDGSAYNVTVPAMPGCLTWGRTREEALASAREAIALHIGGYVERGQPLPADRPVRERRPRRSGSARQRSQERRQRATAPTVERVEVADSVVAA